jgi:hypothetical protein
LETTALNIRLFEGLKMNYGKLWRNAALEAMVNGVEWTPINLQAFADLLKREHYKMPIWGN